MALPADIRQIAAAQTRALGDAVAKMSDADLVAPTACAGWLAAHLLVHVRLGLAEHATSFVDPAGDEPADRDYVSYWRDAQPADTPTTFGDVRFHWATAASYASVAGFREHFADTVALATAASASAPPGRFRFQGHVMEAEDILAMWVTEWVVHLLDLGSSAVLDPAVDVAVLTLDGLIRSRPPSWDDRTYIRKATGRLPLDAAEREFLGDHSGEYPAFG